MARNGSATAVSIEPKFEIVAAPSSRPKSPRIARVGHSSLRSQSVRL